MVNFTKQFNNHFSPISSISVVREILKNNNLNPKYSLGQNFLINDDVIGKILNTSEVNSNDVVLEVGPGMGVLTCALLSSGAKVIAIEKDPDMVSILKANIENYCKCFANNLEVLNIDSMNLNTEHLKIMPNKFISNLPYNIAATLILKYFKIIKSLNSAVCMVQSDVADRIMSNPNSKNYGAYTVKLSLYSKPLCRFDVSPGSFYPQPRVVSSVIRLDRTKNSGDTELLDLISLIVDGVFFTRRKTIQNSMKNFYKQAEVNKPNYILKYKYEDIIQAFKNCGIDVTLRGETLKKNNFISIAKCLAKSCS